MQIDTQRLERIQQFPLRSGSHVANDDINACVMEAVAWVAGEPWSDHPECACPVITAFMVSWNDGFELARGWSMAPYPADCVHADGSVGSTFTCPECNARLHHGESLTVRAYLRGIPEVARYTEAQRVAADLDFNRMKNSGQMLRREIDRAHLLELSAGVHA